jgi:hypothetical protein
MYQYDLISLFLLLLALLALAAYASRWSPKMQHVRNYLEHASLGSIYGAFVGFILLLVIGLCWRTIGQSAEFERAFAPSWATSSIAGALVGIMFCYRRRTSQSAPLPLFRAPITTRDKYALGALVFCALGEFWLAARITSVARIRDWSPPDSWYILNTLLAGAILVAVASVLRIGKFGHRLVAAVLCVFPAFYLYELCGWAYDILTR